MYFSNNLILYWIIARSFFRYCGICKTKFRKMSPLFFNNNALSRNFSETHFFEENIFGTRKMVLIVSFCSVSIFFLLFIFLVYRVSLAGPRDGIYIEHFYKYISRRYDIQSYSRRKQMFRRDENEKRKKKKKRTSGYYPR